MVVLPKIKSYPEIAWDMGTTFYFFEEVCGSPGMEVHGLMLTKLIFWANNEIFYQKMGLRPAQEPPVQIFQHKIPYLPHFNYFLG